MKLCWRKCVRFAILLCVTNANVYMLFPPFFSMLDQLISFWHVNIQHTIKREKKHDKKTDHTKINGTWSVLFGKRYFHFSREHIIEYLLRRSLFAFSISWSFTLIEYQAYTCTVQHSYFDLIKKERVDEHVELNWKR